MRKRKSSSRDEAFWLDQVLSTPLPPCCVMMYIRLDIVLYQGQSLPNGCLEDFEVFHYNQEAFRGWASKMEDALSWAVECTFIEGTHVWLVWSGFLFHHPVRQASKIFWTLEENKSESAFTGNWETVAQISDTLVKTLWFLMEIISKGKKLSYINLWPANHWWGLPWWLTW